MKKRVIKGKPKKVVVVKPKNTKKDS